MLNQLNIIGRLGRDPEIRYTTNGNTICNFSVAVSEKYKNEEKTEWFRCVSFGKLAEVCGEYLKKGKLIYVSGRIQTNRWEDRDGNKKETPEVVVNIMKMLSPRDEGGGERHDISGENSGKEHARELPDDNSDEIPF